MKARIMKPSNEELRVQNEIKLWEKYISKKYSDAKDGTYLIACMRAAQKVHKLLMEQHHTGTSISITMEFLNELVNGMPLTPLTGDDNEWDNKNAAVNLNNKKGLIASYQNNRYTALFKEIYGDGTIKYHDNNRVICYDPIMENSFQFGLANLIYDEMYPIKMPYYPKEPECIEVFTFQSDQSKSDVSDFDTAAVLEIHRTTKNGDISIPIDRFFREPKEGETPTFGSWVEIDIYEFNERIKSSNYKNLDLSDLGLEDFYNKYIDEDNNETT